MKQELFYQKRKSYQTVINVSQTYCTLESNRSGFHFIQFSHVSAARAVLYFFFVCTSVFAESKPPESKPVEIRKAISVSRPSIEESKGQEAANSGKLPYKSPANDVKAIQIAAEGRNKSQPTSAESRDQKGATAPNTMQALNDKRRIGIRDKLSLTIVEDELPQRQIVVTDSGEVDVPYVGRVSVENRTCKQLAIHLKNLFEKDYYYQATVLISLDSAGGQVMSKGKYYLDGQVNRPGQYEIPVDEVLTVSKAIIRAGGFTQYANRRKVRLIRKNAVRQETEIYRADMVEVMEKGQGKGDIEILPDDQVFVDEKFFNF